MASTGIIISASLGIFRDEYGQTHCPIAPMYIQSLFNFRALSRGIAALNRGQ